jgi:hypothetical protein
MKYFRIVILTTIIVALSNIANSQIIDAYGVRVGAGLSDQYWDYKKFSELSDWKDDKLAVAVYLNAEKHLNKYFSLRPEIGYIQKGFAEDIKLTNNEGEELRTVSDNLNLHNLSFNLALKIRAFNTKIKPYLIAGLRLDYLVSYKNFRIEVQGKKYGIYKDILNDFNKFSLSGLVGIGCEFDELMYLDFEINPAITKNLDNDAIAITDRYIGLTLGININKLI